KQKGGPKAAPWSITNSKSLADDDVRSLQALRALGHVELDVRAFSQRTKAAALNRAEVDEHIFATLRRDETKTLRIVEPLDGTSLTHACLLVLSRVALEI